jgi:PAS domain S-box-containing protein
MHFVGMLALQVSFPVAYNVPLLALSILIAIAGSAVTFFMSARSRLSSAELFVASLFMGPAIAGMHYTGMAAMRMPASLSYHRGWLALSVVVAVAVSYVALQLAMRLRRDDSARGRRLRIASAAIMGAAVYGMHYIGMLAAKFSHVAGAGAGDAIGSHSWSVLGNYSLAAAVTVTTFMILSLAALGAIADRRIQARVAEAGELRRALDLLHAVIEYSPEAIITTDLHLSVTEWNPAASALLGWERDEAVGANYREVVPDHQHERLDAMKEDAVEGRLATQVAFVHRRKDGTLVDVSVSLAVLRDADDQPRGFVFLVADETTRNRLDARIRQSQKMEAVGQLAGGVAHDFNNLLTAIISYTGFLLGDTPEDDKRREDVIQIEKAAQRGASLTKQLLAFSRQQITQLQELSISDVVEEMHPMLCRLLPENIRVVQGFGDSRALVKADRSQVEQVLLNLVVNARDAMPNGGTLRIKVEDVVIDETYRQVRDGEALSGSYVSLTVSDTGTGMTPEVQARMFEPFFTTKPPGSGTGLGLASVYGIVKQSGGCISVESAMGRGTSFEVLLPRADLLAGKNNGDAEAPRNVSGSETILLIEDDPMVRAVAVRALTGHGYRVFEASNGNDGIRSFLANARDIDLVITDMMMPGIGGYEVEARLRKMDPALRILFISGYSREALDRQRNTPSTKPFLSKPFTSEILAAKVRDLLDTPRESVPSRLRSGVVRMPTPTNGAGKF